MMDADVAENALPDGRLERLGPGMGSGGAVRGRAEAMPSVRRDRLNYAATPLFRRGMGHGHESYSSGQHTSRRIQNDRYAPPSSDLRSAARQDAAGSPNLQGPAIQKISRRLKPETFFRQSQHRRDRRSLSGRVGEKKVAVLHQQVSHRRTPGFPPSRTSSAGGGICRLLRWQAYLRHHLLQVAPYRRSVLVGG